MRTRKRRARLAQQRQPFPEAISGGAWRVQHGQPMVDLPNQIISVPTEDTEAAAFLRAHELAHIKITPPKHAYALAAEYGISLEAMQAVEDLRVHTFLKGRKIESPLILPAPQIAKSLALVTDVKTIVSMYVSMYPCGKQVSAFLEALNDCGQHTQDDIYDIGRLTDAVVDMFRSLVRDLKTKGVDAVSSPDGFAQLTVPVARFFDSMFFAGDEEIPARRYSAYASPGENEWGKLELVTKLPMTTPKKNKRGQQKLWREDGVIPVAPYRLTLDNKIFTRKRKLAGGTVLIDASGSMSFSDDDLANLIAVAPGARVAVYAGEDDVGRLVIVADSGKMTTCEVISSALTGEHHRMYGNVVDGPALEWLARQPAPRIWVSDGMVTGKGDRMTHNLRQEAIEVMRKAHIERIENWAEVLESLR